MRIANQLTQQNSRRAAGFLIGLSLSLSLVALVPLKTNPAFNSANRSTEERIRASSPFDRHSRTQGRDELDDNALEQSEHNWGLAQIETAEAWRLSRGRRDVVVAVIDTGIDADHPALRDHLWTNPGESGLDAQGHDKATNGVDDDLNGYVDDVHGYNFVARTNDLTDRHGHGTHIAGIISSVAPEASLMILKYYDPRIQGAKALASTIEALRYAAKMGAIIINYSGGGMDRSALEEEAIQQAATQGILLVAAAGNESSNSDLEHYYPADYGLTNILSVTAIDPNRSVLDSSNYGERSVDLAAPGENILSTLPGGGYGTMTGTSQATAFASGAAALLKAHKPALDTPEKLIRHLVNTGLRELSLEGKTRGRTVLNSYRALAMEEHEPLLDEPSLDDETLAEFSTLEPEKDARGTASH